MASHRGYSASFEREQEGVIRIGSDCRLRRRDFVACYMPLLVS